MKSLFVTRWSPAARNGGAALRNAQNIAALADKGPVDVLSIGAPEYQEPTPAVRQWQQVAAELPAQRFSAIEFIMPGRHPLTERYRSEAAKTALRKMLKAQTYDLVVVEELSLAPHIEIVRKTGTPCVFDAHNVEARLRAELEHARGSRIRHRLVAALRAGRLRAIEAHALRTADLVWVCSEEDARYMRADYPNGGAVHVVPNTVNTETFAYIRDRRPRDPDPDVPRNLLFTATFTYRPNEDAAMELMTEILPRLRARGERVRMSLVGREPTKAMYAAAQAADDVGTAIRITGSVPDIVPHYADPAVFVAPLRAGSGTRLKIVEAFAAGLPVVATAKAVEGLEVRDHHNIRIAETPDAFVAAIAELWENPVSWQKQVDRALEIVRKFYSWQAAADAINASFEKSGVVREGPCND